MDFSGTSLAHACSKACAEGLDVDYRRANYLELELGGAGLEVKELIGNVAGDPYDPEAPFFAVVAGR